MAVYLVPSLGSKRLDAITSEDVQRLKGHLKDKAPKTVNNVLTVVNAYLIVLTGGEAGLRCGEMMALEWRDVDLGKRQSCVQRSEWKRSAPDDSQYQWGVRELTEGT